MPIPTEVVGSLPRPENLQSVYAACDAGKADIEQLHAAQDVACKDSIERMEATGQPMVTDGEQRASSFATYPLTDTLGGTGLADCLAGDGQYFAIFEDGHHRQLPRLVKGPFHYKNYAADYLKQSIGYATGPMKQAVIAPSMLCLLYPLEGEIEGYTRAQFHDDLVDECEKDIRKCFEVGAHRVSVDFTEGTVSGFAHVPALYKIHGRLALRNDPRNPWTGRNMLESFIELNNRVFARFSAKERKNIGIHTCPGGDCDSVHSLDVDYSALLPSMFKMNAGYFLVQVASETDKEKVYKLCGEHSREDADGVPQVVFVGVINPLNPRVETPEEVCEALVTAAKYIPLHRLGATDDCGFSPFSIDVKPLHGGADVARDVAFAKIKARVEGARMASEKLRI